MDSLNWVVGHGHTSYGYGWYDGMERFDMIERFGPDVKCSHTSWHFRHSSPALWWLEEFWETWWCMLSDFPASRVSGVVASKNTWIIRVCVFAMNFEKEVEVSSSPAKQKLHLKKLESLALSWSAVSEVQIEGLMESLLMKIKQIILLTRCVSSPTQANSDLSWMW